jgi:hypothetical protein
VKAEDLQKYPKVGVSPAKAHGRNQRDHFTLERDCKVHDLNQWDGGGT